MRRVLLTAALLVAAGLSILGYRVQRLSDRVVEAAPTAGARSVLRQDRRVILLAIEDPRFYSHAGVDLRTPGAGWTTITQGLVKVYGYGGFVPGILHWRKLEQSLTALVVNRRIPKDVQLAMFIDGAYMGTWRGKEVDGFDNAARVYFGRSLETLDDSQYLAIVAMLPGPDDLHVLARPDRNAERVHRIERLLAGECRPAGWRDVYYEDCA